MLRILRLPSRAAVAPLIRNFDSRQATWVVSDLRSKLEIQQFLLERDGGYLDTDVLRASDLWKMLLKRARPRMRIVSRDFAASVVRSFLQRHREELDLKAVSERSLMAAMDRFAGVAFHPEGTATVTDWFADNPDSENRWGRLYLLARAALGFLLSQDMITEKWIAAALQSESRFGVDWTSHLMVDLGAELSGAEAELFKLLSQTTEITLLQPFPRWEREADFMLRPYADIEGYAAEISDLPEVDRPAVRRTALRLSGQLAEVKETVSRARAWIESGVAPEEIAVLAPRIEEYWPVLKAYLDEEGLPADKNISVRLNSLPSLNKWLAKLRPRRGELTPADLELSFYSTEQAQRLRHDEFRALFANLYGEEDLRRHPLVESFHREGPRFKDVMKRDEFLLSAALFWDERDSVAPLQLLLREVLQNALPSTELPLPEWIRYLESVAATKEWPVEKGDPSGILVTNLISARTTKTTHRIFLGLSEEGLKKAERNPLPLRDVRELSDLGFHLDHPDHSLLEFELRWLSSAGGAEDLYLVGVSSFEGSIRAPSALWLKLRQESSEEDADSHALSIPGATRWDFLQRQSETAWARERGWSDSQREGLHRRLRQDFGEIPATPVPGIRPASVSPSFVRNYLECPFLVAGSALFRLKDLEEIDLDVARSDLGTLTHAVFQALTDEDWISRPAVGEAEMVDLIESIRTRKQFVLGDEKFWGPFLKRQTKIALEFLRVEKEWKRRHPALRLLPSETPWTLWFEPSDGSFHREEAPGRLRLSGRIDRLETDGQGRYAVVDYKASASAIHDQHEWMRENDLQLLFYLWALERGAMEGIQGRAIGAFYYVYRDFSRDCGLQIEADAGVLYPPAGKKKNLGVEEDRKLQLFAELEERLRKVLREVGEGRWWPEPADPKNCGRCAWNGLCRAKHLN
ncbi:MAG: PD-(D/E)XK nuclease family protein [Bdellovibrionaceae bacterium]|nr:PD-(D/E)XK nuclease family protein [Pseudobdellovibrionaceae bacterium]MBX3032520.1 PD-(D/E)XK nuclease family protein [Pseudobdellovibrionaceae bacterium]